MNGNHGRNIVPSGTNSIDRSFSLLRASITNRSHGFSVESSEFSHADKSNIESSCRILPQAL